MPIVVPEHKKGLKFVITYVRYDQFSREGRLFSSMHVRSCMNEDRFNALVLLFFHKNIDIDIQAVLGMYARKYHRRMLLLNPLN